MTQTQYNMTYAKLVQDSDDSDMFDCIPQYNIICFSTRDINGSSIPALYFIPKDIKFPKELIITSNDRFVSSPYNLEDGQYLHKWLDDNADHCMNANMFVSVNNFGDNLIERSQLIPLITPDITSYSSPELLIEDKLITIYIKNIEFFKAELKRRDEVLELLNPDELSIRIINHSAALIKLPKSQNKLVNLMNKHNSYKDELESYKTRLGW